MVVDANIIFAALIAKGVIADILFTSKYSFYAPEECLYEIQKYESLLKKKTHRMNIHTVFARLMSHIHFVANKTYKNSKEKATAQSPDPNDAAYLALAHHLKCPLWSDDKELKNQNLVLVINTQEILSTQL